MKVTLIADLNERLAGHARMPKPGSVGTVLAQRDDKHVLVKFKGRAGPLSLCPTEYIIVDGGAL